MRLYLIIFIFFGGFALYMTKKTIRGIRNNNPLNIRKGNDWQGETSFSRDAEFESYTHHKYGFRAGAKTLRTYQRAHGLDNLNEIINRFAPPVENDTKNYAQFVAKQVGVGVNESINLNDDQLLAKVLHSMSIMEVGRHYSFSDAMQGVKLA
ncbi:structural protein [Vibrio cortegadensis]|uniref:structural protein n=1 Tax=Vibrio cortegadensis TaxID=1328770 RepID=UPI0021C38786|nr:structural protein [Vibrio cortegadensis]MDN3697783.1 structural protein [Vibrio cortegadensis]